MSTIPEDGTPPKGSRAHAVALATVTELSRHAEKSHAIHEAGDVKANAYLQVIFAQLALPYKDPVGAPFWERRNGKYRLVIQPGTVLDKDGNRKVAYPYGSTARLFLIWMSTEVKRKKVRELELGASLNAFMQSLGFKHRGGNQRRRVEDQLRRLFSASITVETHEQNPDGSWMTEGATMRIAKSWQLWFSASDHAGSSPLAGSRVVISEEFYEAIMASAVPLAAVVLRELQSHPMRLDIYVWLVHRLYNLRRESHVSWKQLEGQFGGAYSRHRDFVAAFEENLRVVRMYYPMARVSTTKDGVILRPSQRHLDAKGRPTQFPTSAHILKAVSTD